MACPIDMRSVLVLALAGCARVVNGSVTEHATIPAEHIAVLRVPEHATVETGGDRIDLAIEKTLAYHGHPTHRMSIDNSGALMGMALRRDGDTVELGTYGEWGSIEGGAGIKLTVRVPRAITVERDRTLEAGEQSRADGRDRPPADVSWFGSTRPADGWTRVP
jgi:hypothetical protein